jgi:hypothetical protein
MDMATTRYGNNAKVEPMNTFIGSQNDRPKKTCNWCGYGNHHEKDCQQQTMGKLRKEETTTTLSYSDGKKIIKCFYCGCTDYHITNCKVKIVFFSKEAKNKNIKEYSSVKREDKSGLSKSESMLREGERESSYSDDSTLFREYTFPNL